MPERWMLRLAHATLYAAMSNQTNAATAGISFGSALAMILSFQLNHSILWAIVHGVCTWFYVIYRALKGNY
jgi:hypothetical protein